MRKKLVDQVVPAEASTSRSRSSQVAEAYPHDPTLPDTCRNHWLQANWKALSALSLDTLVHHPERARLAVLCAAAALQLGDRQAARAHALRAIDWGADRREMGRILIAGARHTLGRASYMAAREQKADAHFEKSVAMATMSSEARRHAQRRRDHVVADVRLAVTAATTLRAAGAAPTAMKVPAWLTGLVGRCMESADVHESVDACLASMLGSADDKVRFLMLLSDRFLAREDRLTAVHFLNTARDHLAGAQPDLGAELAQKLVAVGGAANAVDLMMERALAQELANGGDVAFNSTLLQAYSRMRDAAQERVEHGHELLLNHLRLHGAALKSLVPGRKLVLIEIGSTREEVPGQGSTRKLATYCAENGLHFVTVDMDPHNTHAAQNLFKSLGLDFEAIAMNGEDFLRQRTGPIDLVFLDAYDFDHGNHSEMRQSRYEKFLGARIDEQACHRMHLDCAETLERKLEPHGLICVDDTWLEHERWVAKGTLAMPYLLANGFRLLEARNRAALLARNVDAGG